MGFLVRDLYVVNYNVGGRQQLGLLNDHFPEVYVAVVLCANNGIWTGGEYIHGDNQ